MRTARRDEFLVNAELTNTGEHTRKSEEHTTDMVSGIHVGCVKTRDYRINASLLCVTQRRIFHGDGCVGERVVVERSVAQKVIVGCSFARDKVILFLLERYAEHGNATYAVADHLEIASSRNALLYVVCQVEVSVIEKGTFERVSSSLVSRCSLAETLIVKRLTNRSHRMVPVSHGRVVVVLAYGRLVLTLGMSHPFNLIPDLYGTCFHPSTLTEGDGRFDMVIQPSSTDCTLVSNTSGEELTRQSQR